MENYSQDCAALLEMAQEVAIKYGCKVGITVFSDGQGWADAGEAEIRIGFSEPKNKALIREG